MLCCVVICCVELCFVTQVAHCVKQSCASLVTHSCESLVKPAQVQMWLDLEFKVHFNVRRWNDVLRHIVKHTIMTPRVPQRLQSWFAEVKDVIESTFWRPAQFTGRVNSLAPPHKIIWSS